MPRCRGEMPGCASSERLVISKPQKQRAKSFFVCVGSFRPFTCIRYFHAFQSRFWRHSSKCASVRVGRSRFHASSNSARASNVSPVPLVCCPGSQPGQKPQVHAHCDSGNRNAGTNSDVADADVAEVDDPAAVRTLGWSAGKFGHGKKLPRFSDKWDGGFGPESYRNHLA
jgi:hypothetical protein